MMCKWIRWQLQSARDRDESPSARCVRHLAGCAACTSYAARLDELHAMLTLGAPTAPAPVQPQRAAPRRYLLAVPVAACAAALYLFLGGHSTTTRAPAPAPAAIAKVSLDTAGAADAVQKRAIDVLDAAPLRQELSALLSDGARGTRVVLGAAGVAGMFGRRDESGRGLP